MAEDQGETVVKVMKLEGGSNFFSHREGTTHDEVAVYIDALTHWPVL